jgi:uncharacterized membrane protein AbrB (regulator of aidB expression)
MTKTLVWQLWPPTNQALTFLTTLIICLIKKIIKIPSILFATCFIIESILNFTYRLHNCNNFLNKMNDQGCKKKQQLQIF